MRNAIKVNLTVLTLFLAGSLTATATAFGSANKLRSTAPMNIRSLTAAPEPPSFPQPAKSGQSRFTYPRNQWPMPGLPSAAIAYAVIYPGMSSVVYTDHQPFADDLKVAPGADFKVIDPVFENLKKLSLDRSSRRLRHSEGESIVYLSPMTAQEFAGVKKAVSHQLSFQKQTARALSTRSRR